MRRDARQDGVKVISTTDGSTGRHRRRRRLPWLTAVAVVCVLLGGYLIAHVILYRDHSSSAGHALVERATRNIDRVLASPTPGCARPPDPKKVHPGDLVGVLKIPALKLTAPVVEGVEEGQLSIAVGHLSTSAWPGSKGTSVLAAHDVTWFSRIDHLRPGDEFTLQHGCAVDTYRVSEHKVVKKGSPLYHAATPQVVLETCWPTTALYWTNDRYLVFSDLVDTKVALGVAQDQLPPEGDPFVDDTVERVAQGSPSVPHGTLQITGTADDGWRQSNQPLLLAHAAISNYRAGLVALTEENDSIWRHVDPHQPRPALAHPGRSSIGEHLQQLDIQAEVVGQVVRAVRTTSAVHLLGQGSYRITTRQVVTEGKLRVANWSMTLLSADPYSPTPTPSASATPTKAPAPATSTTNPAPKPTSPTPTATSPKPSPKPTTPPPSPPPSVPPSESPTPTATGTP